MRAAMVLVELPLEAVVAFECDQCRTRSLGTARQTATGRDLCPSCYTELIGASAAVLTGGGVPEAIATAGWYARVRAALRRSS